MQIGGVILYMNMSWQSPAADLCFQSAEPIETWSHYFSKSSSLFLLRTNIVDITDFASLFRPTSPLDKATFSPHSLCAIFLIKTKSSPKQ